MNDTITIDSRTIGPEEPLFVIAECGVTCNYDLDITKELIDVVAESGADAIKFIFWFPDEIMSDRSIDYEYETVEGTQSENMYEMLNELRFSLEEWRDVKDYADEKGVILFSTVNSPSGIEYAEELDLAAYKLSSWDYNYHPLFDDIASLGKPMLLDTGPVRTHEVANVMNIMRENDNEKSVLIHCYHTDQPEEINMRAIPYMRDTFDTLVGFSSKDRDDEPDIMAVSLGASVVEKRLTLDRSLPGHHHVLCKEPDEFDRYVDKIRDVHRARGEYDLTPSRADLEEREKNFRHLVADDDIPEGTVIETDMIEAKRPEKPDSGVHPRFMEVFVGKTVNRDVAYNDTLTWDDIC